MFMIEDLDLECLLKMSIFKTLELGCYQNQELKEKSFKAYFQPKI